MPEESKCLSPVQPGHDEVKQHEIECLGSNQVCSGAAVLCLRYGVADPLQMSSEKSAVRWIVVYDQDAAMPSVSSTAGIGVRYAGAGRLEMRSPCG